MTGALWALAVAILLSPSLGVLVYRYTSQEARALRARQLAVKTRVRRVVRRLTHPTVPIQTLIEETR